MLFEKFIDQLSQTNSTPEGFVDFAKVINNVNEISIKLNQLNYLIGKDDIKQRVAELYSENPSCFSVLNILIAVRDNKSVISNTGEVIRLSEYRNSPELVYQFISETGLEEVLRNKNITNLVDYVFGIEVGLDSNARKNRGGKNMENAVAKVFEDNDVSFEREVKHTKYDALVNFGDDVKRFDFMIQTNATTYLIETNFYNTGGSKLNEVARAYTDLAPKVNENKDFEFVWITDGMGWLKAKNKLQEAFGKIPKVYNLASLHKFIEIIKKEM